jgi:lysylphosphatidylglycerol synthetase-like protein (DUF2156 family)
MLIAQFLTTYILPECLLATGTKLTVVLPLSVVCVAVIIVFSLAARRGRLHIPGYVGIAFLASFLALVCGHVSGSRGITATPAGVALSALFFLLVAAAAGAVLALFFYRDPPET